MVADGNWLIVHDAQYDRTSYLPLDGGILGALLYPDKFNQKNQLLVIKKIIMIIHIIHCFLKVLRQVNLAYILMRN